jgi:hypothetical protein
MPAMSHIPGLRGSVVGCWAFLLFVGCGASPKTTVQRIGTPRPARGDTCELTLVSPSDTWPGGKYYPAYETIGLVNVDADGDNAQPGDPDVKQKLRPQACALGGELIALVTSNEKHNRYGGRLSGRFMSFQVLAPKAAVVEQKY